MTKSDIKVLLLICIMFPCFILGMIFVAAGASFVSGMDAVKSWIKGEKWT